MTPRDPRCRRHREGLPEAGRRRLTQGSGPGRLLGRVVRTLPHARTGARAPRRRDERRLRAGQGRRRRQPRWPRASGCAACPASSCSRTATRSTASSARSRSAVRDFLRSHVKAPAPSALDEAARHLASGNVKGAKRAFEEALRVDTEKDEAHLGLARLALAAGDLTEAEHEARAVDLGSRAASGAQSILEAIELLDRLERWAIARLWRSGWPPTPTTSRLASAWPATSSWPDGTVMPWSTTSRWRAETRSGATKPPARRW